MSKRKIRAVIEVEIDLTVDVDDDWTWDDIDVAVDDALPHGRNLSWEMKNAYEVTA